MAEKKNDEKKYIIYASPETVGQHFFVSDGSNYENSKIRFPYFAPCFKGNAMEIREVFIGVGFRSVKTAAPNLI